MQPCRFSAAALLKAYRSRALSPVEAIQDVLMRIAAFEQHIQATWPACAGARARGGARVRAALAARRAGWSARWRPRDHQGQYRHRGRAGSAWHGGERTETGAGHAPPAARLREAGAIIFAKTTMPDYGMLSSGLSSFHPLTRNPWDLARNPGGSSAGAAAAAAAGYGPLHLGTDIGGSVRLPAGWCGLVGFKPSAGRVPIDPPYYGRCRRAAHAASAMRHDDGDAYSPTFATI